MKRLDRRALFATGAAAALLAATGTSLAHQPRRGGVLRMAVPREEELLSRIARSAIYDQLTEVAPDGLLRGELAAAWESDVTAREWRIELQANITFHDGADLTAEDVASSLEAHVHSGNASLKGLRDLKVSGDGDVVLSLHDANPDLPYRLADAGLIIAPAGQVTAPLSEMTGTGLYRVERAQEDRHLRALRVDQHYKDGLAGWFDALEFVVIPDAGVRAEALRDGYVDIAALPLPDGLPNRSEFSYYPSETDMVLAASQKIALPSRISKRASFDDHRIAERWWMA